MGNGSLLPCCSLSSRSLSRVITKFDCKQKIGPTLQTSAKLIINELKGVFSKPSGKRIVAPFFFLFFELETSDFGYLLIFNFVELCIVWAKLGKVDISHFIRVPPLMFFDFVICQKFLGDPYM